MKTENFVTYRIIFVPGKELIKIVVDLANEISKLGNIYFKVDEKSFFSHITIYKAEFPIRNGKEIFRVLNKCSKEIKCFILKFNQFYAESGWLGLGFKKNKQVYETHKKIVKRLNPLRKGHIQNKYLDIQDDTDNFSGKQRSYVKKYGYPLVMSEYRPHLSLLRFVDENVADTVAEKYNNKKIIIDDSLVKEIAIVQGGEHGTVNEYIEKISLKG